MNKITPYSHQYIDEDDIKAVIEALTSDSLTQGPKVKNFENALCNYCGSKYAVVFSSGTSALKAACFSAGIKKGNEIITSPITFLATVNVTLFWGARPVFIDIEPDTANTNPELIEKAIGPRTKAIVPVDYGGHPVHLEKISEIAEKHNLLVIEDACHSLGAEYKTQSKDRVQKVEWIKIGNCRYVDMVVFSFHPVKSITTGEGGAVLTDKEEYYEKLIMFRQHGVTKDKKRFIEGNPGDWYYEMHFLGYNYRLTDIQCALGISQLRKLDKFIQRRRDIVEIYKKAFKDNEYFDLPTEKNYAKSSWHLYPIRLRDKFKEKRREIFRKLKEEGIGVQVHYIPVYWQPYYQSLGYKKGLCPVAEDFYQREISIPIYPSMTDKDIQTVANKLLKVFKAV